jgi:hypothetical protein
MSSKRKLRKALRKAEKLRDEWCAEYTKVRDRLALIADILKAS